MGIKLVLSTFKELIEKATVNLFKRKAPGFCKLTLACLKPLC